MKLVQREALEAKAGGRSEHGQGGGRRLHYLDRAQRAVKFGGASRKPTGNRRECARVEISETDVAARTHGSQRRHRGADVVATGKANVFGI